MRFLISLSCHGRSYYLLSDPSRKRKKVNEDREIDLFEEEKHNQNSELQKEIEKLNSQLQEYKSLAAEGNMAIDRLNEQVEEGDLDSNYETKIRY